MCVDVIAGKRFNGNLQMKSIGFINQKGGVGKTTLALNVASELARRGRRVLYIDADPQGSALDWAAARQDKSNFQIIGLPRPVIHKDIQGLGADYDFVIIDSPPTVQTLGKSCVGASDIVLIPVQPSPYDIWAAKAALELVAEASVFKENSKTAFVINRKISNTAISRDVVEALSAYDVPVMKAQITQRVVFAESAAQGKAVWELEASSAATSEIEELTNEILTYV
jgi:chromosome partitioning protein